MPTISLHGVYPRPYKQELQATPQTVVFNVPQDIPKSWCIDNIELDAVVPLMSVDGIVEEEILHLSPAENSKHQLSSQSLEFGTKIQFKYVTSTLTILELCKVSLIAAYLSNTNNQSLSNRNIPIHPIHRSPVIRSAFCATFSSKVLGWTLTLIEGVMAFGLSFRAFWCRKLKLEKIPSWRMDKHG